jgi:hypothetical protein
MDEVDTFVWIIIIMHATPRNGRARGAVCGPGYRRDSARRTAVALSQCV